MAAEIELQTAIIGALYAVGYPVYDDVPQDTAAPYIVIGDSTLNQFDADGRSGFDCLCTIHSWSAYRGRKEVKEMQAAIYEALHRAELTFTNYSFIGCDYEQSLTLVDADDVHRHGVQQFRVKFTETVV